MAKKISTAIAIDLGGTKTAAALVNSQGEQVSEKIKALTPAQVGGEAILDTMAELIQQGLANLEAERNAVMLEYMKEKDVASMSGRLLNRWGRVKKPQLLARLDRLEQQGQIALPGFDKGISA